MFKKQRLIRNKKEKLNDIFNKLNEIGFTSGYNTKFLKVIIENITLVKELVSKIEKISEVKRNSAIKYNDKNYIVKETYISYNEFTEYLELSEIVIDDNLKITRKDFDKIKILK